MSQATRARETEMFPGARVKPSPETLEFPLAASKTALRAAQDGKKGSPQRKTRGQELALKFWATESNLTQREIAARAGVTERTLYNWLKNDAGFREKWKTVAERRANQGKTPVPDFPEFCETYLSWRLYRHQLQWYDILEGRAPRDLHEAQIYEPGRPTHIILNTPPEHAKTTTITVAYVVWSILRDPDQLILLVSKNRDMAADFLSQVKDILSNPMFEKLHQDFAPEEGFERACTEWSNYRIRFGPQLRTKTAKDPTVQALGIKGQIYGKRATKAILDDCIDTENAADVDKQFNWINRMVLTRLGHNGTCLVVGSRVAAIDLYRELRNPQRYAQGESEWTYFAQPAVEVFDEDPENWVTLWPKSNQPQLGDETPADEAGQYPMWNGSRLRSRRGVIGETAWAQAYQQQDINEDATFPRDAVNASINGGRWPGLLREGTDGHPPEGMAGKYVIGGLDPAAAGYTAAVVLAIDRVTAKRYVLDVSNVAGMTPDAVRALIKRLTETYGIHEWRVEKNAFQTWLTQDTEMRQWMASKGVRWDEHETGRNKLDVDFGVASMSGLFSGWQDGNQLIELPTVRSEHVRALRDQLVAWEPKTKNKQDTVMALWFAEIRAREIVDGAKQAGYLPSPWLSEFQRKSQIVVDMSKLDEDQRSQLRLHSWWDTNGRPVQSIPRHQGAAR